MFMWQIKYFTRVLQAIITDRYRIVKCYRASERARDLTAIGRTR